MVGGCGESCLRERSQRCDALHLRNLTSQSEGGAEGLWLCINALRGIRGSLHPFRLAIRLYTNSGHLHISQTFSGPMHSSIDRFCRTRRVHDVFSDFSLERLVQTSISSKPLFVPVAPGSNRAMCKRAHLICETENIANAGGGIKLSDVEKVLFAIVAMAGWCRR